MSEVLETQGGVRERIFFWGGPLLCAGIVLFLDLSPGNSAVTTTAGIACWMALWWLTGVVSLAATALLPLVLFPAFNIMDGQAVAANYINDTIFLFLGGFLVAIAMQYWDLHRRIALRLLLLFGVSPRRLMLGFMAATFFLSMWISNTATTMMMVPIVLSILQNIRQEADKSAVNDFGTGILLSIAYSASIGGTATLIGTPPNAALVRIAAITFPDAPEIDFATWFFFAFPIALVLVLILWIYLTLRYCPRNQALGLTRPMLEKEYKHLGKRAYEENVVLLVFLSMAILWLTRTGVHIGRLDLPGWSQLFGSPSYLRDGTIAIAGAIILFIMPARNGKQKTVLNWNMARDLPWEILILFGGGFALAAGFKSSGLSEWLGGQLHNLSMLDPIVLVLLIALTMSFLTELTSNTATTNMMLPIMASLAIAIHIHPWLLMIPTALACSYAFMLPVATPPNAIVFGSQQVSVQSMIRTGFILNIIAVLVVTLAMFTLGEWILKIAPHAVPDWVNSFKM